MFTGFFNSLSIRIPLAVIGGILYGLLTYYIVFLLNLSSQLAIFAAVFVFLFYFGSRLLILFSGFDSPYYSKGRSIRPDEENSFYQTAQWVGKCYHYHDIVLFSFLILICIAFLISLIVDWAGSKPFGDTIRNLLAVLFFTPESHTASTFFVDIFPDFVKYYSTC